MRCPELLGGGSGTHSHAEMGLFGQQGCSSTSSVNGASPLGKEGPLSHQHLRSQPREKMDPAGQRAWPETDPILGSRGSGDRARLETDPIHARHFGLRMSRQ